MANGAEFLTGSTVRALLVGYPGSGKTGALCCLLDAGFKLRVMAYDKRENMATLVRFVKNPAMLRNLDIVTLEDKLQTGRSGIETKGVASAYFRGLELMDRWKYKRPDGTEVDLGRSSDWGPDTVVVLDSLTAMGQAAKRRAASLSNRTMKEFRDTDWGMAMGEQEAFIERLTSSENHHHVVVTAHLTIVGPNDVRKGEEDVTRTLKERLVDLVPTRIYPSALGKKLPPLIGQYFSTVLLVARQGKKRVLQTLTDQDLDLKVPAPDFPATLSAETGLLEVFERTTAGVATLLAPREASAVEEKKE